MNGLSVSCGRKNLMNKIKILYIHHGKGLGGAPLSLLYLIQNLNKEKYQPVVLFLHDSDAMQLYKAKGIEVFGPVNVTDFSHTKIYWFRFYHLHLFLKSCFDYFRTTFFYAKYWLDKIQPDIVHLNTSSLIAWAKVAYKKKIPVIFHIREPLAGGYFGLRKNFVRRSVAKYSNFILPICNHDAKPWLQNPKTKIIYNAVDGSVFDKNLSGQEFLDKNNLSFFNPRILFLGGLSREKGTLEILEIFQKLLKILPEAKLLIAGYFDLTLKNNWNLKRYAPAQRYVAKVKNLFEKIQESVILLGPIENVPQIMAASDVVVFPATVGHFARPIIEAGFMSKPVVASNFSPLNELVIFSKTGFLIDIKRQDLWVEKLHTLLTNKTLNAQMGKNAFDFCAKNFDIKNQINQIEQIYSKVEKI
jgi:glycosyltransferase involved in cell wall biosynthesis